MIHVIYLFLTEVWQFVSFMKYLVHFCQLVKFISKKLHMVYPYYYLNIYRICSDAIYLIPDIGNLCLLSLFFFFPDQSGQRFRNFLELFRESSMLSIIFVFSFIHFYLDCHYFLSFVYFGFHLFSQFLKVEAKLIDLRSFSLGYFYQNPTILMSFYFCVVQSTSYFSFRFLLIFIYYLEVVI